MRYCIKSALFALLFSPGFIAYSQGCKHLNLPSYYTLFEATQQPIDVVLKNAASLDSVKMVEARLFEPDDTLSGWKEWLSVNNYTFDKNRGDIPMITDLNSLHPYFRDKIILLIARCRAKGIELAIVESYRTRTKQAEYQNMGKKYTRSGAGKSKHQYGLAIDVVPMVNGKAEWHNLVLWRRVGITGEQLGLRWGGRWKKLFDPGHFEWTGGLSSAELAQGKAPHIPRQDILYPCLEEDVAVLKKFWEALETDQAGLARK
jgi:hypothetical protein